MNLELGDTQLIIKECRSKNILRNQVAYILATAYWESNRTMKPVREAYWLSEGWRKNNLRYYPFYGRGYVQLTWKDNYEKASIHLNTDLVSDPDSVMRPRTAVKILVEGMMHGWFTGKSLPDYVTLKSSDFYNARKVVNKMDRAAEIAGIARNYDAVLKDAGYGEEPIKSSYGGFLKWLISWLSGKGKQ